MHRAQTALETQEVLPWHVIINYTSSQPRPGRSKKVTPRDKTKLRQAFLDRPNDPFHKVARDQGLDICANKAAKIAREPSPVHPEPIVKKVVATE